ncbi:hypothetical protein TNCV_1118141, partial [Trichonephila clavipes]
MCRKNNCAERWLARDRASAVSLKIQNGEGEKRATRRTRFVEISPRSEELPIED